MGLPRAKPHPEGGTKPKQRLRVVPVEGTFALEGPLGAANIRKLELFDGDKRLGVFVYVPCGRSARGLVIPEKGQKLSPRLRTKLWEQALMKVNALHSGEFSGPPRLVHACIATPEEEAQLRRRGVFPEFRPRLSDAILAMRNPNSVKRTREMIMIKDRKQFEKNLSLLFDFVLNRGRLRVEHASGKDIKLTESMRERAVSSMREHFEKSPFIHLSRDCHVPGWSGLLGRRLVDVGFVRIEDIHRLPNISMAYMDFQPAGRIRKGYDGLVVEERRSRFIEAPKPDKNRVRKRRVRIYNPCIIFPESFNPAYLKKAGIKVYGAREA